MAFALTMIKLEEAFQKKGCPLCRVKHDAAVRYLDVLLWENTNDPGIRKPINDAHGFCNDHTRMLVAVEKCESGTTLGVNIIYDLLAKNLSSELNAIKRKLPEKQGEISLARVRNALSGEINLSGLKPTGSCPVCVSIQETETNALLAFFEEVFSGNDALWEKYKASSGLCLGHTLEGLSQCAERYPQAAHKLIADSILRLDTQRSQMQEYIRKQNWAHREESLSAEENTAWLKTLAFFTGYPPERFNHKIDKF
jgi:hypothetical protein